MNAITEKLFAIKLLFSANKIEIAPIIVTDNSWAIIGAVLRAFNNMDAAHYLDWCYKVLFTFANDKDTLNQCRSLVSTRIVLCSTHFLKNLIKELKKVLLLLIY
jgi:hypothetical protein